MMNQIPMGWHILYVKSRHEIKIGHTLKEYGFDSFVPTVTEIRQWSDRKKKIQKPLFSSYVFVNIKGKQEFYKALTLNGVFKYVRFGNCYGKIKEHDLNILKELIKLEGISNISTIDRLPVIGERMVVNYGPLSGLSCLVIKTNNHKKVFVRIESLRQNIIASIPAKFLTFKK